MNLLTAINEAYAVSKALFLLNVFYSKPIYSALWQIKRDVAFKIIKFDINPGPKQGVKIFKFHNLVNLQLSLGFNCKNMITFKTALEEIAMLNIILHLKIRNQQMIK